jgi:hypothetical protein
MSRHRASYAVIAACVLGLSVAAPAAANYYYSERGAEKVTKDAVKKRYDYSRYEMGVSCRPQGAASADSRYLYHRWVCTWAAPSKGRCDSADETIFGQMLIVGRSGAGAYSYKVLSGAHCDSV